MPRTKLIKGWDVLGRCNMYQNVLIPLDGLKESESVIPLALDMAAPDANVTLLGVVSPTEADRTKEKGTFQSRQDDSDVARANAYLLSVLTQVEPGRRSFRNETVVADNVLEAVAECARQSNSDLIVMFEEERKGITGLFKKSMAEEVQKLATTDVKTFKGEDIANYQRPASSH
jgi:nucleotide-binding universal stress UspA family protein